MARPQISDQQCRKERIQMRNAALELYREGGFTAITMRAVGERLEISPSRIYRFFRNQRELMDFVFREPIQAFHRTVSVRAATEADPLRRMMIVFEEYVRFAAESPEVYRSTFMHVAVDTADVGRYSIEEAPAARVLLNAIVEAQAQGLIIQADPRLILQSIWSAIHGAITLPINLFYFQLGNWETVARQLMNIVISGLRTGAPNRKPRK